MHGLINANACRGVAVFTADTKNASELTCDTGVITVTGTAAAKNVVLKYEPQVVEAGLSWTCSSASDDKYLPAECR